ncbi:MAG: hypothetical protein NTU44_01105 [Bacteroidetes bacterium]|nr:hypothetical protein [Bacteroidota bacterium]
MDEKPCCTQLTFDPERKEYIPNESILYRFISYTKIIEEEGRRFPNEASFDFGSDGLSMNWDKYSSAIKTLRWLGMTFDKKRKPINYRNYRVFRFSVKELIELNNISYVQHNPLFHGNPPARGIINNKSHTLVIHANDLLEQDINEIRLNLLGIIRNDQSSWCPVDEDKIAKNIEALRKRIYKNLPEEQK